MSTASGTSQTLEFVTFNVGKGSPQPVTKPPPQVGGTSKSSEVQVKRKITEVDDIHEQYINEAQQSTGNASRYETLKSILEKFKDTDLFFIQQIEEAKYVCKILNEIQRENQGPKKFRQFWTQITLDNKTIVEDTRIIYNSEKFVCESLSDRAKNMIFEGLDINRHRASSCTLKPLGTDPPFVAISWHDHWKLKERFSKRLFQNIAKIVNMYGKKQKYIKFVVGGDFNQKIIDSGEGERISIEKLVTIVFPPADERIRKADIKIPEQVCIRKFSRDFFAHNSVSGKGLNLRDAKEIQLDESENNKFDHFPVTVMAVFK